jgi:hypothetical protein
MRGFFGIICGRAKANATDNYRAFGTACEHGSAQMSLMEGYRIYNDGNCERGSVFAVSTNIQGDKNGYAPPTLA